MAVVVVPHSTSPSFNRFAEFFPAVGIGGGWWAGGIDGISEQVFPDRFVDELTSLLKTPSLWRASHESTPRWFGVRAGRMAMSMGRWDGERQLEMFVPTHELASGPTQVFYERLNQVLREAGLDGWLEALCADFYAEGGRPSIPPGTYFRMLLIGYFEAIESQRGIAWRCQDSLSLRTFLRFSLNEATPDHSRISKIGDRLPLEVYEAVFAFVLKLVNTHGLLKGQTVGVDSTLRNARSRF